MTEENVQTITLDGVIIPYSIYGGEKYYPIRYVMEKFLLKTTMPLYKNLDFKPYIENLEVNWSFKNTVPQKGYCMNRKGWKIYLDSCKNNKNKTEDKAIRNNLWCDYIGSNNKTKTSSDVKPFNTYEQDCIDAYLNTHSNIKYKTCKSCCRKLPDSSFFFIPNNRYSQHIHETQNTCRLCDKNNASIYRLENKLNYNNKECVNSYKYFGEEGYINYKKDIVSFYIKYIHGNENNYSIHIEKKYDLFKILEYYYNDNLFDYKNVTLIELNKLFSKYIINFNQLIILNNFIEHMSNKDCLIRPYKYKNYKVGVIGIDTARDIIDTYLIDNNIIIEDIFNFNYNNLLRRTRLTRFDGNILDFVVKLFYNNFPGYKFKINSVNYYKDLENRIFDMKYLVEKDMHIDINKIPLYITRTFLHKNYASLYGILNKSYYNNNIFKWINECYPNKFIEKDFDINKYRIEFDSFEEAEVDRVLRDNCSNVIYNIRNSKNEVTVKGFKPDWIIVSETGCYIVEYFGMYVDGGKQYKSRLGKYKIKTESKFEKYKELREQGYKTLYIFPEDLKNNYKGLIHKVNYLKLNN